MCLNAEPDGFVIQKELAPHLSTVEVAHQLGAIINIDRLLPFSGIPTVQSLRPRGTKEVQQNQYSGHFGFDRFPLHTDLAHWILPPHCLLLRCLVGTEDVFTNLLPCRYVIDLVGAAALRKAVLRIRRRHFGCSGLVRAMSPHHHAEVFRWDPVFLEPLSRHARALQRVMVDSDWDDATIKVQLRKPGDTILIDNWRMLHGRSQVPPRSILRHVERVYLSEVFQ